VPVKWHHNGIKVYATWFFRRKRRHCQPNSISYIWIFSRIKSMKLARRKMKSRRRIMHLPFSEKSHKLNYVTEVFLTSTYKYTIPLVQNRNHFCAYVPTYIHTYILNPILQLCQRCKNLQQKYPVFWKKFYLEKHSSLLQVCCCICKYYVPSSFFSYSFACGTKYQLILQNGLLDFLGTTYQNGRKFPITIKYTKRP
jgi:hypothetical protein